MVDEILVINSKRVTCKTLLMTQNHYSISVCNSDATLRKFTILVDFNEIYYNSRLECNEFKQTSDQYSRNIYNQFCF